MNNEEFAFARERTALQGSNSILSWLEEQQVKIADQGQLVENARLHISSKARAGLQSRFICATTLSADQRIAQYMPGESRTEEPGLDAGLVQRFAQWVLHGIPDAPVRQRAFELTLSELGRRCGCATLGAEKIAAPFLGSMPIAA